MQKKTVTIEKEEDIRIKKDDYRTHQIKIITSKKIGIFINQIKKTLQTREKLTLHKIWEINFKK